MNQSQIVHFIIILKLIFIQVSMIKNFGKTVDHSNEKILNDINTQIETL